MEYRKIFKYCSLPVLITLILYLLFMDDYALMFHRLRITSLTWNRDALVSSSSSSVTTDKVNSSVTTLEVIKAQNDTHFDVHHPQLAIKMFSPNISLVGNTSKLILLGNGFFGDRDWGLTSPNKSSTEQMRALFCSFLSDRCFITTDYNRLSEADAVVYHMRNGIDRNLVKEKRHPKQRFVFALWESPAHTPDLRSYQSFFNWTMTYRFDSDIVASYYSGNPYIHKSSPFYQLMLIENATRKLNLRVANSDYQPSDEILQKKKLGTVAALISNCGGSSKRLEFVDRLKRYIDVKVYGRCGEACPSNMNCRQFIAQNYYFILSFENSLCTQYTTEKFFASLEYPVVPVVLGRTNYSYFIPASGFIDTNDFTNMSSLARHLNETRYNKEKYLSYFAWKKDYVWGLQNFFSPFCDLCLSLHLDLKTKIIEDIHKWWFENSCQSARIPS